MLSVQFGAQHKAQQGVSVTPNSNGETDYVSQALQLLTSSSARQPYQAGSYVSPYTDKLDSLINDILGSSYSGYDAENDQTYKQYKKTYLREADRAQQDVMGQYAALTGGVPSSSAITAASQAGNQMRGELADLLPQLAEADYDRYLSRLNTKRNQLSDLMDLENLAYGKYADEEDRRLTAWELDGDLQNEQIAKLLQAIELQDSRADRETAESDKAYDRVLTLLAAGIMPGDDQLQSAGVTSAEANKLMSYLTEKESENKDNVEPTFEEATEWLEEQGVTDLSALMTEEQFDRWNEKYGHYASYEDYVYDYALQRLSE